MSKVVDTVVNVVDSIFEVTGLGALWDSLSPDVPEKELATLGQGLQKGIDQPRRITFGRDRAGGVIAHQAEVEKGGKKWMQLIVLINGAPIDALEEIYIADKKLTDYPRESWDYSLSDGRQTTANAKAVAKMAGWTSEHVGFGQSYVFIEMENNREVFEDGINDMGFLIRGARVWDPRDTAQNPDDESTWLWSQNAVLCALHYVRFYGAHEVPFERLPLQWWIAAINVCDEGAEFTDADGVVTTEPRYTTNGSFTFSSKPLEVLGQLEACFAGKIFRQMGQWYVRVGAWYGEPTYTINADDVHGNIKIKWHADLRERANVVRATFTDPEQNYDRTDAPPVVSAGYQAIDNQILEKSISLPFVRSSTTAQRLATIHLEQTRLGEIELPLKHKGLAAAVGRTVFLNLPGESINNKVYRVTERRFRLDGGVTLMCVEDGPDLWADNLVPGAQDLTPNSDYLVGKPQPIFDVRVTVDGDGKGTIKWNHPTPLAVNEYDVEFINTVADEEVFKTSVTYTQVTIPDLQLGEYTARISAKNIFGQRSLLVTVQFSVLAPTLPTVYVTADYNQITLTANFAAAGIGTSFEWEFLGATEQPQSGERVLAQIYNRIGLKSQTEYKFRVRSVNHLGASDWVYVAANTTTIDLTEYINNVELTQLSPNAQTLIEDINTQVDRLRPGTEGNLPELLNRTVNELNLERQARTDIEQGVFDLSANYTNWRQNYEQRQLGNERLIDAAVYIDPENGTIVNRAFAYTDEAFTEANVLIDGVNARIELQANRISQSDTRLSQAEAMLLVQAGQITQRATFTEIQSEIAGAIESLRPAYSWQFNSNNEGFSNVDSYNPQGYIVATAAINSPSINYIADENPMFRLRVRLHSGQQWIGEIIANNGEALINVPSPNNTDWQTLQVDATGTSGYTGNITSLELNLGACDIDFIEVGKRGANDLALNDITARTTELETDINAATGAMAQYATTTWVNQLGYQTQSNVNAIINTFDTTYQVSATLQTFDENGTLEKANNAQQFINGAEAYITNQITAFNAAEDGIDAKLSNVDQTLDALNGTISQNIVQVRGLELDLQDANLKDIINSVNQLLKNNELTQAGVKLSIAQSELQAKTTELEAQASQSLELATIFEQASGQITVLNQIVANEKQATVIRDERYLATFEAVTARFSDVTTAIATIDEANTVRDQEFESFVADTISSFDEVTETFASQNQAFTTLEQSLTSKIETDTEQAQNQAVAKAQEYTRTAVGYCVDANGDLTSESDAVVCVADGGSWVAGPLAEYISNLQISDGESTASIKELKQVFKKVNGELVARGGWVLDNNGRAVSVAGYNDGETGNLDLVADVIRQGVMVNDAFVPTSYIDNTDPGNPVHTFKGRMVLGDGHTVESLEDIRAQDGVDGKDGKDGTDGIPGANGADGQTNYTWVKYADSASGSGLSNSPTNKEYIGFAYNKTTATESTNPTDYKWSKVKGEDGTDGIPGAKGADGQTTYTWIAYSNNPSGSGMYQTPNENTLYIGIAVNKTTATESNQPADYTWSRFKGNDGNDGNDGRDGINGNNGVDGSRGSVSVQVATASGIWYDSTANAALPSAPVIHDRVTIYKTSDPKVQTTKRFNGASWESYTFYVHGSAMIEDTLDGNVLRAGTRIESPRIDLIGDNFMKIELASGFGPDDLWYWMGPKIYKNGLPDLDSLTKANAKEWKDRNANSFTVGTFISGAISNSVSTSQHTSSPTAELAFTSNGNNINFAVSYTHFRQIEGPQQGEPETVECPVAPTMTAVSGTVYLERNVNGSWLSVRSKTFSGTYNCQNGHYDLESRGERNIPYRSITNSNVSFTEIETPGTGYQQYRVRASLNNFFSTPKAGHYLSLAASE